jgi:hypothetical protein
VSFDPKLLPHTAAYVAGLPKGLDSYPHCRVRSAVSREILEEFPHLLNHPGVDPGVRKRLRDAMDQGEWMLDSQGMATRLLVRDIVFTTDRDYHRWFFDISGRLFAKPFYRFLMYVVSPTLVVLGATKRWAAFREGSLMTANVDRNQGKVELAFPVGLYPEVALKGFGETILAALTAARARDPKVELVEVTPTRGQWRIGWM